MTKIQEILFSYQDEKYADFTAKLIPTEKREIIIGVRSPAFKKIVPDVLSLGEVEVNQFLEALPHQYHEENILHICLINKTKDFNECLLKLEKFLPYISNWAVSDGLSPKIFEKNTDMLISKIKKWINDEKPYTKRVGMLLLKKYFLEEEFKPEYLELCSQIRSPEYYVNMMTAWLFSEALVKQWDATLPFILEKKLDSWTHNKAIQKSVESFRITPEQKDYLRSLKVKISRGNN